MKLAYISPSILPSRSANSVHVVQQCAALKKAGADVTLFANRQSPDESGLLDEIRRFYGVDLEGVDLRTIYTPWTRANSLTIALYALAATLGNSFDGVLSRNLFASFLLSLLSKKPLTIEVHQLESGFRGCMQRIACRRAQVRVVTISGQLSADLEERVGPLEFPIKILHDAASETPALPSEEQRRRWRAELLPDPSEREKFVCGYVGHLYPGRGIEIIEALAAACPDMLFLVIGGNEDDVVEKRKMNDLPNLRYLGYVPHPQARKAMCSVDLLLMPYQEKVSIGLKGQDTGRWMSPMKMFEYMSSGTPFVASDLPVLREVLDDGRNSVLAPPQDLEGWRQRVEALKDDPSRRRELAQRAYQDYHENYTWRRRAEIIINMLQ